MGLCRFGHVLLSVIAALGEVCRIREFFFLVNKCKGDMNIPKRSCWCKSCFREPYVVFLDLAYDVRAKQRMPLHCLNITLELPKHA
jgi:hypothetical protein